MTKNGKPFTVPLTDTAAALLRDLPRALHSEYVFAGATRGRPLDPFGVWKRVRKRAGVDDVTLHDLRRSCGSMMDMAGVPTASIRAALNHSDVSTTMRYVRPN